MRQAGTGTFLATGGYAGVSPQPAYASLSLGRAGLRAAVSLLHDELEADGVHVTGVTIAGAIDRENGLDPDHIADTYWTPQTQPPPSGEPKPPSTASRPSRPSLAGRRAAHDLGRDSLRLGVHDQVLSAG
jgi:hypothetical protein